MFESSGSVKKYIISRGVDPDTVYLNDYKFMKAVFHILVITHYPNSLQVAIFGYKPSVTIDQFFRYGFSEQKMILCCDVINLVRRASKDIKISRSLNRKRSETSRQAAGGRFSIVDQSQNRKDYSYERDTINKVAKVTKIDDSYLEEGEKTRS